MECHPEPGPARRVPRGLSPALCSHTQILSAKLIAVRAVREQPLPTTDHPPQTEVRRNESPVIWNRYQSAGANPTSAAQSPKRNVRMLSKNIGSQ